MSSTSKYFGSSPATAEVKGEGETVLSPTSSSPSLKALKDAVEKDAVESQGASLNYGLEYRSYRGRDNAIWLLRLYTEV